ncbi:YbaK/EbsC family protein [Klebsiella grimontii]|uniref:YbaK/EbsC family protein n=1 Tax=Klebsiella grimontii TaxID=2058152 RepID=UPI00116F444E|nr:YbaK/EbsC family protein [Klebsiella grimontii]VUT05245.1 hypothetical protein SPARK1531C2_04522 [Klebsiella grimontii]
MSLQSVRQFFADHAPDIEIIELTQSTATVTLAAAAHNVEPGQIAKTLSLKIKDRVVLVVAKGDEVITLTGHPIGGVCPFGLEVPLAVYCDISLRQYPEVLPAAGSIHSAVRISPERMAQLTDAKWIDVCL